MRLAVHCDGSVVVTSPLGIRPSLVERFVCDKRRWVLKKIQFFKSVDRKTIRPFSCQDYLENKDNAMTLISERVRLYSEIYGFSCNKISIKNQRTRWGSCSRQRNLNLNYRIMFLPRELQDYIIVHEVCHLKEFNHSRKFWLLVAKACPDYLAARKELRYHQL